MSLYFLVISLLSHIVKFCLSLLLKFDIYMVKQNICNVFFSHQDCQSELFETFKLLTHKFFVFF